MIQPRAEVSNGNWFGATSAIRKQLVADGWVVIARKLLGLMGLFLVVGMLVAGLWPFHSPRNQVRWSATGNGIHMGRHGTALSSGKFQAADSQESGPCSFEIWFEPDRYESGTLFSFYTPGGVRQLSLAQWYSNFVLKTDARNGNYRTQTARLLLGDIFYQGRKLFVTVTSGSGETLVYIDGVLARTAPDFPLSSRYFDGELVVANSPVVGNSWSGVLRGLAFYSQVLTPAQVQRHFGTWRTKGRPEMSENESSIALYLFDERAGRLIHNQVSSEPELYIPDRYLVLDQVFLRPFWKEFDPGWSYVYDVLVNIGGFIPFGFVFCAYLSLSGRFKRPALFTTLLGLTISLTIEVLQSYLPTRSSGTTDLFTNTFGTGCGVWLYRSKLCRAVIAKTWASLAGLRSRAPEAMRP